MSAKYKIEIHRTQDYEFVVEAASEIEARHIAMDTFEEHWPVANSSEVAAFAVTEETAP